MAITKLMFYYKVVNLKKPLVFISLHFVIYLEDIDGVFTLGNSWRAPSNHIYEWFVLHKQPYGVGVTLQ